MTQTPTGKSPDPHLNRVIAGYRLLQQAGKGGMGSVYFAREESSGKTYAFKILKPELASNDKQVRRFMREARIIAGLDHPHIIKVRASGEEDGTFYIVMEFISGWTLVDLIRNQWIKSVEQAVQIIEQIARALAAAHEHGIVHRDVKPHNVMMTKDMRVRLMDFGLAKETSSETTSLTSTGNILGTPIYMAPEQWRGEPPTPQTDIYALGVLLYEMLTGESPFKSDTPHSLMLHALHDQLPPASDINPKVDPPLDRIIYDMTAIDPAKRYESAQALADDLRAYRKGELHQRQGGGYVMDSGIIKELTGHSADPVKLAVLPPAETHTHEPRFEAAARYAWPVAKWSMTVALAVAALLVLGAGLMQLPKLFRGIEGTDAPLFTEDFENGMDRWEMMDDSNWSVQGVTPGNHTLALLGPGSAKPRFLSPQSIALIKGKQFDSFEITLRVKQTGKEYPARDLCLFFGYQDPTHFYFAHLGKQARPGSQSIFLVNNADMVSIANFYTTGTPWDNQFHTVTLRRNASTGEIGVYFDNTLSPVMTANDKTFTRGRVGIGSFDDEGLFDDIQITRLDQGDNAQRKASKESGFEPLLNGKDLSGWFGETGGYSVAGDVLTCNSWGHIWSEKEFDNFELRFEYKLTSGADSGIAIRCPSDDAYKGMEVQIVTYDNPSLSYGNNGALYGIVGANPSQSNRTGEWNQETIIADDRQITVILNGATIVNANLDDIARRGTADGAYHPGMDRKAGHIAIVGMRPSIEFRNMRIKEL